MIISQAHDNDDGNLTSQGSWGHCIGNCTPTRDRGQSEPVKLSRRNFEAGQAVKLGIRGSLRSVKVSPQCTLQLPEVHIFIGIAWFVQ